MYFVDLPGYGYAKAPKSERETWGPMIERYLRERHELKLALMLVDCRIPPTESDKIMKNWLDHYGIPNAVILMKADKLSHNQMNKALQTSVKILRTKETIAFSAVTGFGKDLVLNKIREATV